MKQIGSLVGILFLSALLFFAFSPSPSQKFKDGDIIFQVNQSGQGMAIQVATGSKFTHVGIIFIENGKPVVYHAVQPVKKSTLADFIAMGTDSYYEVKRLKNWSTNLDVNKISKMKKVAISMLGKNYDIYFNWSNNEIYCSEFVWKIYKEGANLEVGKLRALQEFNLENKIVKDIMVKRYGNKIPLQEKMISPGDMFVSQLLENVK